MKLHELMSLGAWQERVRTFVNQNFGHCVSSLVYELAKDEKYLEELMPVISSDDWIEAANEESTKEEREEWMSENDLDAEPEGEGFLFRDTDDARKFCDDQGIDPHTVEAYEHWLVDDWMASRIEAQGGMILRDFLGLTIWGRPTTGQAIYMDYSINEIYFDLVKEDLKTGELAKELGLSKE